MASPLSYLRLRLEAAGLLPKSRIARTAGFLLGLNLVLFFLQKLLALLHVHYGQGLGGWLIFLSLGVAILLGIIAYRYVKAKLLWRLRNRLIVTYVFIGVIPAMLLMAMAFIAIYLFAGQFANFVVTSDLHAQLQSLEAVNSAVAGEISERLENRQPVVAESLQGLRKAASEWAPRHT